MNQENQEIYLTDTGAQFLRMWLEVLQQVKIKISYENSAENK